MSYSLPFYHPGPWQQTIAKYSSPRRLNNNISIAVNKSEPLHCCFVTGSAGSWHNAKLRAKYALMRWQGIVYPDVYCIPWWLGASCDLAPTGAKLELPKYHFIFGELNSGVGQLEYLQKLIREAPGKIVVFPGPPEIFEAYAGLRARGLAIWILRNAGQVWAYSPQAADFVNDYAQAEVARVIPWPFDYSATRRLARHQGAEGARPRRVLLGVPLRFVGIAQNAPQFLATCISDALAALPAPERSRFKFFAMVYTKEDERAFKETGFGRQLQAVLVPRKNYGRFLRFVESCAAVITLHRFSVLGRVPFIAAALGKPGIFTDNVELSRRLYPHSLVSSPSDNNLRGLMKELFSGLLDRGPLARFLPDAQAAREVGDFAANGVETRNLLFSGK